MIYRIRKFVNKEMLMKMYYAYIQSRLMYGLEIWGACNKTVMNEIYIVQKKVLKILFQYDMLFSTNQLFKEIGVLSTQKLFVFSICTKVFKHIKDIKKISGINIIYRKDEARVSQRNRNADVMLKEDKYRNNYGKSAPSRNFMYIWNWLIQEYVNPKKNICISEIISIASFKKVIKKVLVEIEQKDFIENLYKKRM